mgnify:CR=1 FL=1
MKLIVLDTNFIIEILKNKISLNDELSRICNFPFKILILDKTKKELNKIIEKQAGKHKELAKLALMYIKRFETLEREGNNVDEILTKLSGDYIIATQDRQLKSKLKKPFIVLKQKRILELVE